MDMKKLLSAAAILACTASFAQNINPTVEVTNTYQSNASEIHKPQLGMAVPDSLLRFDMDFDYEVFEKPYQGAYNFKPYMLAMRPDKDAFRGKDLYLRAGAGYSLHPQLNFVYSPNQKGPFQMSVYANHGSYFGKYNKLAAETSDGVYRIDKVAKESFAGHDALTGVGFDGRYNFDKAILSFGIGYDGVMAGDTLFSRSLNAADFNVRVASNRSDDKYLFYDVALRGRYASDHFKAGDNLGESVFNLLGNVGPVLDPVQSILVGFEAETASYRNLFQGNAGRVALVPKYRILTGKWDFNLGIRIEKLFSGVQDEGNTGEPLNAFKGRVVFPEVFVTYKAMDNVSLFASATGGNSLNTYSSIVSRHHFINPVNTTGTFLDNSTEKINAKVGVRGNLGSRLQFQLDGGASVHENGLVDSGIAVLSGARNCYLPAVNYADFSVIYADALFELAAGKFSLDGGLHLRNMTMRDDASQGILLPNFSCDFKAVYDFTPRFHAGVRGMSASSRKGMLDREISIPGYFDLGLLAGYQFNRKLGFWLESGNLLCESIQRSPFYSEKDLWITAGIALSL